MTRNSTRCDARRAIPPWQVLLCALLTLAFSARAAERGFPLMTVYPAEVHKAGPQTFDIAQDQRGVLYFGNLHGLLSWDGAWWRLLTLPDDQVALAVATDGKGTVALGLVDDLGYLTQDASGSPAYQSIRTQLPQNQRAFGDVRSICSTASGFLFVTEKSLILWSRDRAPRIVAEYGSETGPRGCSAAGGEIFLRGPRGLQRLDPVSGAMTSAGIERHVTVIVNRPDGSLIVAVREGGLYAVSPAGVTPFAPEASTWLQGKLTTGGVVLPDGRLVITTRQNGFVILRSDGEIEQFISADAGLPDAVINEARLDREGSLWLAMEGPIVRVDLASPVSVFDVRRGVRGSAGDVARFAGRIYTATTHGLYTLDENGQGSRIDGIPEGAWRLLSLDEELLVGSSKGVYRIRPGGSLEHVVPLETEIYDLVHSRSDGSRVWLAQGDGLGSIRRSGDGWVYEGLVPGIPQYISTVVEKGTTLWCGTTFNGILRIDNPRTPLQKVTQYGSGEMNACEIGGKPVFVRANGAILDIGPEGRLVAHPRLGHITAPRGFFLVLEDAHGDVWINSTPPRVFRRQTDGSWAKEGTPLVGVTASDIQGLRTTDDGVIWFAADKGLFRYVPQPSASAVSAEQPPPLIRRVVAGENRLLFGGAAGGATTTASLRHNFGRVRIEFAPASFRPGVTYQYRLDPIDASWSEWTDQPFIDYTTLGDGDYTFRLRARGAAMTPSREARWTFQVLAPWYRTPLAWLLWVVLAAAAVIGVISLRTSSLRRKAERLRVKVAEKTTELQATVKLLESANARLEILSMEDELTGIANRRFFERALTDEWNRARRRELPLALILLDLDHFKDLNDRRGHPAGDECLRRVGALLAETIRRSGEVVARYGGEEFAVLLPGVDAKGALRVADTLREGILRLGIPYGGTSSKRLSASCGVASLVPTDDMTAEVLVANADRALYTAKHSGRNCVRLAGEGGQGTWLQGASA